MPSRKLKVTLTLSPIGRKPNHVRTIQALGLRRIRATVVHEDTPIIRGMIAQVAYALRVEAGGRRRAAAGRSRAAEGPEDEGAFGMKLGDLRPPRGARKPRKRVGRGPGVGPRQDLDEGAQGPQGALRGRQGTRLRGRADAALSADPQARLQEPVPSRVRGDQRERPRPVLPQGRRRRARGPRRCGAARPRRASRLVKVLADGELAAGTALVVRAHAFSKAAAAKIAAAGGRAEVLPA